MRCIFGEDLSQLQIDYSSNFRTSKMNLSDAMMNNFRAIGFRLASLQCLLFPETFNWFISPWDREILKNNEALRKVFRGIIEKKQQEMKELEAEGKEYKRDFLSLLLSDEVFQGDVEMVIDECLTFFLAGT